MIKLLFFLSGFLIFWGMIGYQFIILLLDKIMKYPKKMINTELLESQPSISILIVAHNEEKVILDKLKNVSKIEYPNEKTEIIVASDHSDDKTAEIVREFISNNPQKKLDCMKQEKEVGKRMLKMKQFVLLKMIF